MRCKLDSTQKPRLFEKYTTLPEGWTWSPWKRNSRDLRLEKRESSFGPFFELVQNTSLIYFSYLPRLCNLCKAPQDMRKFLQKCHKIARWARRLCTQPPIASKPGSSSPERPGLDIITSQSWFDATCPCTTYWSAYFRFVTLFSLKKTRQSTRSDVTGARCVRPWLTRDIVWTGSFQRGWASFRGDRRLRT